MSHPFLVYVIAFRPYAEKVLNGKFYLDMGEAQRECNRINEEGCTPGMWKIWPAHLTVNPEDPDKM